RAGDRSRDLVVEHARDDVVGVELVLGDHIGQRLRGGQHHLGVDGAGLGVQQTAEDAREHQHVVDLVGKSERPVATTAAVWRAIAGSTSGSGFASANTIAPSAIAATSSAPSTFGAETPMKTSAPRTACRSVPVRFS